MPRETWLTAGLSWLGRFPFWVQGQRHAFAPPQKVLILKPCCLSQVLFATPLLAVLSEAYPQARFDWLIGEWARPAVAGNPRLRELVSLGEGGITNLDWGGVHSLIAQLRKEEYDTCFIPSRSSWLAYVAWRAGIPQRVGLHVDGRGFAHTIAVSPPLSVKHEADRYLMLAEPLGIDPELIAEKGRVEFYPADMDRTAVTARLIEELDWLGDSPLVIIHPGGGENPLQSNLLKQWPAERFALLGNYVARTYGAKVVVTAAAGERPLAEAVTGMMASNVFNLAGRLTLGELGAMCEVADLYVGNDTGPTHIAVATGCPTLAIFGPSDTAVSGPYAPKGKVATLRAEGESRENFSWEEGVTVDEAVTAVDALLQRQK